MNERTRESILNHPPELNKQKNFLMHSTDPNEPHKVHLHDTFISLTKTGFCPLPHMHTSVEQMRRDHLMGEGSQILWFMVNIADV